MKSLYDYDNYRHYLRDFYVWNKDHKPYFTYRYFAAEAGLASAGHYKLIVEGKRNLSHKSLAKFTKGLRLDARDSQYFSHLVYYDQATSPDEKLQHLQQLSHFRKKCQRACHDEKVRQSMYTEWYIPLVYELVNHSQFSESPQWICQQMGKRISVAEARNALAVLEENGALERNGKGNLQPTNHYLSLGDEAENLYQRNFQRHMVKESILHIDDAIDEREFACLTVCSSPARIREAKQRMKAFISEMNSFLTLDESEGETLLQFNMQLFRF